MIVRKMSHHVYDVFTGIGWPIEESNPNIQTGQWTRVRRFHWGIKGIAGTFLPRAALQDVFSAIQSFPQGSVENV